MLDAVTVIDLSASLGPQTIMWPGTPEVTTDTVATFSRDGFFSRMLHLSEHAGTHFDAPCHMSANPQTVADVDASRLVGPVRVLDISAAARDDPDAVLDIQALQAHETTHGRIEAGTVVLLRTGWDERAGDAEAYGVHDDGLRFPGFGVQAAGELVARGVIGLGIDTLSIDAGVATDYPVHRTVTLPRGVWHLENLANLGSLPAAGAWVVVGVPKLIGGSGCPARVLALVPAGA